ncbi:hypothetical protein B0T17DRAFT_512612 [Bombardia bombarda]|uniref:Uncharacterized protein n=1 Tax=Bombardia bombarda TaxID=252184 RepID=A0AA39T0J6_9PEZI|nr:hypothetical protein B0T17DRAFT_512612 [Bombardia bombarda]
MEHLAPTRFHRLTPHHLGVTQSPLDLLLWVWGLIRPTYVFYIYATLVRNAGIAVPTAYHQPPTTNRLIISSSIPHRVCPLTIRIDKKSAYCVYLSDTAYHGKARLRKRAWRAS